MPNMIGKNLHMCFTKITCSQSPQSSPLNNPDPDHHHHHHHTLFIKNYNSLYNNNNNDYDSISKPLSLTLTDSSSSSSSALSSDPTSAPEPDFATVVASQRFFFTTPGRSNSIVESITPPSVAASATHPASSDDQSNSKFTCAEDSVVAVPKDSPDPYTDFRRSMQEMVEARDSVDVKADWDYLHDLLLCYLSLNPKTTHKFIISAFADLLLTLMSPPGK